MKDKIRKEILEIRKNLSHDFVEETSKMIMKKIIGSPEYQNADYILCYIDVRKEVQTKILIEDAWNKGKIVAAPRVEGEDSRNMEFYQINSFEQLSKGTFGILEPNAACKRITTIPENSIIIVPGVAFDLRGNRIGYGAGYYDSYFQKYPDIYKIAPVYPFQIVPKIPAEEHDIKVDKLTFVE
ncbi:MAG: 5-formyltetrahydrofolate cyclo-ligase [Dorea sp.]